MPWNVLWRVWHFSQRSFRVATSCQWLTLSIEKTFYLLSNIAQEECNEQNAKGQVSRDIILTVWSQRKGKFCLIKKTQRTVFSTKVSPPPTQAIEEFKNSQQKQRKKAVNIFETLKVFLNIPSQEFLNADKSREKSNMSWMPCVPGSVMYTFIFFFFTLFLSLNYSEGNMLLFSIYCFKNVICYA